MRDSTAVPIPTRRSPTATCQTSRSACSSTRRTGPATAPSRWWGTRISSWS